MKFPLFIDIEGASVLIVGAGRIAQRRTAVLKEFGADITVVSKRISERMEGVLYKERAFEEADTEGRLLVIACTDDRAVNKRIGELCRQKNIFVSVADSAEESTFFFPAVCKSDRLCAGLVSDGSGHSLVRETAEKIRRLL